MRTVRAFRGASQPRVDRHLPIRKPSRGVIFDLPCALSSSLPRRGTVLPTIGETDGVRSKDLTQFFRRRLCSCNSFRSSRRRWPSLWLFAFASKNARGVSRAGSLISKRNGPSGRSPDGAFRNCRRPGRFRCIPIGKIEATSLTKRNAWAGPPPPLLERDDDP